MAVQAQQIKIVGYPVCIEDDKYHRNALLFNIAAYLKTWIQVKGVVGYSFRFALCLMKTWKQRRTDQYYERHYLVFDSVRPWDSDMVLILLGALVEGMEKESGFLHDPNKKKLLGTILPQILRGLTLDGECTIPVDAANIINLKLFPTLQDPSPVSEYQVPVAIRDLRALIEKSEWDLALQQIVPFIDGIRYVKRISLEADVEIAIVKKCVRQLLYYGCVTLIDIFLHSNIYATTSKIHVLANDPKLQAECAVYIAKSGHAPPSFARIFALYCSIQPSLRMNDFCVVYSESLASIDVRRFITFGLIHGFLRRVHRYPICIDRTSTPPPQQTQQIPQQNPQQQGSQQKGRSYGLSSNSPSLSRMNPVGAAQNQPCGNTSASNGNGTSGGSNGTGANITVLSSSKRGVVSKTNQLEKDLLRMMDGSHHTDEICTKFLVRNTDVESTMQLTSNCFAVNK
ncbi:hypothetical protein PsorP6_002821 [Peronosclerospora sorghi]|uniref:Uncharacterized protein n=1 Tax=Peronosclerospora sorghi TaxID=230839 RepID=A0ACC0VP76_9STRA|nr:hypothetical protein PsorP6_002821 [Peronosclerospora sorghi]